MAHLEEVRARIDEIATKFKLDDESKAFLVDLVVHAEEAIDALSQVQTLVEEAQQLF